MARVYYERLTDESAAYLERENSRQRAHTAMTLIFDAGPLATADGGVNFKRIREVVEARLGDLPRLRCKLRRVPTDGHPVWVDDAEFNLDYHLRQTSLPRPGNDEQLARTAARVAAGRLDRSRPLWDCWVIEGLERGRFAIIVKMHKALAVEQGADLIDALLSANEDASTENARRYRPRPAPSPVELFSQEVLRRWSPSRRLISNGLRIVRSPSESARKLRGNARDVLQALGYALRPASESPFDGRLGPHRTFEMESVSFEAIGKVHQSVGGSIHDVVLALLTGTLRRFMESRFVSPVTLDLRALTPVLDADGSEARPWAVELPLWEPDAAERIRVIREQTSGLRSQDQVVSGAKLSEGSSWTASSLFSIGARALQTIENGHIPVLQAPGPREPLFLEGARLEECYGFLPLQDSCALGITALSYAGRIFLAFNADPEIVPDLDRLQACVATEMEALSKAAENQGRSLRAISA